MLTEVYRDSIHIDAEPDFVYGYFTRPEALVRWMGDHAVLDPRQRLAARESALSIRVCR